ncbi:MAG TPA: hypothetical protein VG871_04235 [Vicinamibacterales bacterium]|nr:hypothetical protein [Vicinamibacterales bacterium]
MSSTDVHAEQWKQLPSDEWRKRLHAAREIILSRLFSHGLTPDDEVCAGNGIDDLVLDDSSPAALGELLAPGLLEAQRVLGTYTDSVKDPEIASVGYPLNSNRELSAVVMDYAMRVAEAAYLVGVISGMHSSWAVLEAMPPPYAPAVKTTRRSKKAGTR